MRKILTILACLLWVTSAWSYDFNFLTNAETLFVTGNSMNLSGTFSKPDSIRLRVYQNATEVGDEIYGWGSGFVDTVDTQAGHDAIHIHIPFDSLDGATSSGIYQIEADFKKNGQDTTAWTRNYSVKVGYPNVNVAQISGDGTSADNLEEILDGDATGADMRIDSLRASTFVVSSAGTAVLFEATGSDGTGLRVLGEGSGSGFYSKGGATGHGHYSSGGITSGHGVYFYSADGIGAYYYSLDGQAIKAYSYDTTAVEYESGGNSGLGHGLYLVGAGTGIGLKSDELIDTLQAILDSLQATLEVNAIQVSGDATAADNLETMLDGTGGQDLVISGLVADSIRVSNSNDNAVSFTTSAASKYGLYLYSSNAGDAARFQAGGGSGHGLSLIATSGNGLNAVSSSGNDIDGDLVGNITGNLSGSVGSVTTKTGFALSNAANEAIADSVLKDSTYYFDASADTLKYVYEVVTPVVPQDTVRTGDTLAVKKDSLVFQGSGASASTIRDAVWSKDTTNTDTIAVLAWMEDNLATGTGQDSASTDHIVALALAAYKAATMPSSGAWSSADSIGYQNLRAIIAAKLDSIYLSLGTIDTSSEATVHEKLGAYDGTAGHGNLEDELDTALTHLGGTGPYALSLYIKNTDDDYLEDANVTIRNSGGGSNYFRRTGTGGLATLNLTTGTWYAIVKHTTNQQVNTYDTITIAGAAKSDTISMTAVSVGSGFCRVYADLYDFEGGAAIQGVKLTAEPNRSGWRRTADGYIFLRKAYTALTDASGYVYMDLPRSSVFTSDRSKSLKYTFSLTKGGGYSDERIPNYTVPDSTTHRILFYKE